MLALTLDAASGATLRADVSAPARTRGESLVRMRCAGVCDTDLQLVRGYMNYRGTLGHEFVGDVLDADDPAWVGRRVVADINAGCGQCDDCRLRDGHHCAHRTVLGIAGRHGAIAEQLVVPERCLVAVPDGVADDAAVFAEPLAAALHVLDALGATRDRVVVLGDGKLGLLIALALLAEARGVLVLGHHVAKLELAAAAGADVALATDIADGDARSDAVVEATGTSAGLARALRLARPRGTVVLKTTVASRYDVDLAPVVVNEVNLVGSRCGSMVRAVAALSDQRVDPRPLIAARYPLSHATQALSHAGTRGVLKVLIENLGNDRS
jgi:threonine dehydrogenase-like Zn-dependent dehydrogenase